MTEREPNFAQARWEQKRHEVDELTDGLGKGIDENIKDAVTALRVFDFPTSQSCEGHVGEQEEHGATFPWIQIYAPEPEGWQHSEIKQQEWKQANQVQRQRMERLLKEFYQDRDAGDERIIFHDIGIYSAFRLQSAGAEKSGDGSLPKQLESLQRYRQEMNAFTAFLRSKLESEDSQAL